MLAALGTVEQPIVFTMPNADTNGRAISRRIKEFVQKHPNSCCVDNLGTQAYFSIMKIAAAMVGNSSSGIIEAASFKLPVVNVGNRQAGRVQGRNVIDVGYPQAEIASGLQRALSAQFRASLAGLKNPYGCGNSAGTIVRRLTQETLGDRLLMKRFYDWPRASDPTSARESA
jgi:UDP-hydrolysing UDP-N-acetyl-D-glucosamine 2-epimerase